MNDESLQRRNMLTVSRQLLLEVVDAHFCLPTLQPPIIAPLLAVEKSVGDFEFRTRFRMVRRQNKGRSREYVAQVDSNNGFETCQWRLRSCSLFTKLILNIGEIERVGGLVSSRRAP